MSDLKPIQGLRPFTKFCCTIGNLPASYLASMTYEEQLLWFCDYLQNTVIPTVNNNAEAVEELQNLYLQLKNYVDNYFTNLDVQNEINNKLDEMVEDGTLENIINQQIFGNINNDISNLKNTTNILSSNYTIMIGDSYGRGSSDGVLDKLTGWCDRVKSLLNLNDNEYLKLAEGASGFTREGHQGHTFKTLLTSNLNNIQNKNLVKNIILCGGYNDRDSNLNTIINAISSFVNVCKTNFPNAKIFIGFIGNNSEYSSSATNIRSILNNTVLPAYKSCIQFGANYLNNVELCMHNYTYLSSDNYHPNETGYQQLSQAIFQSFITGNYNTNFPFHTSSLTEGSNSLINFEKTNFQITNYARNDSVSLTVFGNIEYTVPQNITINTANLLGTVTKNNYIRRSSDAMLIRGMVNFIDNSNNSKEIYCTLNYSNDGGLYLSPITSETLNNIKRIEFNNFNMVNMLNW